LLSSRRGVLVQHASSLAAPVSAIPRAAPLASSLSKSAAVGPSTGQQRVMASGLSSPQLPTMSTSSSRTLARQHEAQQDGGAPLSHLNDGAPSSSNGLHGSVSRSDVGSGSYAVGGGTASPPRGGAGSGSYASGPQRLRSVPQESSHRGCSALNFSAPTAVSSQQQTRSVLCLSARSFSSASGLGRANAAATSGVHGRSSPTSSALGPPGQPDIMHRGHSGEIEQDALHDAVKRFSMQRPQLRYPLVRLARGVYLFGNKKLVVAVHNEKLMVRIGGGFVNLESYLVDVDRSMPTPSAATPVVVAAGPAASSLGPGSRGPRLWVS